VLLSLRLDPADGMKAKISQQESLDSHMEVGMIPVAQAGLMIE
jgi:hypothetical protein